MKTSIKYFILFFLIPFGAVSQSDFEKGKISFEKRELESSKKHFMLVTDNSENYDKAQEYIADIAVFEEEWDTAIDIYEELLEEFPEDANLNFKYGGVMGLKCLTISKFEAAFYIPDIKKYLKKAATLDENHIESRWALVQLYIQLPGVFGGSYDTANEYANQLLAIDTLNGSFAKGYVAEHRDEPENAKQYYLKAMQLKKAAVCQDELTKLPSEDIENNSSIIGCEVFKRNQLNYLTAKVAAEYNFQNQRGILYIQRYIDNFSSIDGEPLNKAYYRKAQLYRNLGNKKEAKKWIEKSLALEDDFDKAQEEKSMILAM